MKRSVLALLNPLDEYAYTEKKLCIRIATTTKKVPYFCKRATVFNLRF